MREAEPAVSALPAAFPATGILRVGEHRLDLGALRLLNHPEQSRITLKAAQVLLVLAARQGETVSREHLLDSVWPNTTPTPEVVTQAIKELRRALNDSSDIPQYIQTVPKLGYRLIANAGFEKADDTSLARANSPATVPAALPLSRRASLLAASGLAALLVVVVVVGMSSRALVSWNKQAGWAADQMQRITSTPLWETWPRISSDGSQVAFLAKELAPPGGTANMHVKLRGLVGSRAISFPVPAGQWDNRVFWMPGGNEIAIVRQDMETCGIIGVPTLGGTPRTLGSCSIERPPFIDWSPDGLNMIASHFEVPAPDRSMLQRQAIGGGPIETLDYPRQAGDIDISPTYSPDGSLIAFRRGEAPYSDLYVMEADAPRVPRRLTRLGSRIIGMDWTRDGTALVFSSDHAGEAALYTIDIRSLSVEPLGISPAYLPNLARNADIGVYAIPDQVTQFALLPSDGSKPARLAAASTTSDREAALSPAADRVAFITRRSSRDQVWLQNLRDDDAFALTDLAEGTPRFPTWRADGGAIGYVLRGTGPGAAWEIDIESRKQRRMSPPDIDVHHLDYAPDGRLFAVAMRDGEHSLFALHDGKAELIEPQVSFVRAGSAESGVLVNYLNRSGVYRLDDAGGPARKIGDAPNFQLETPWALSGSRAFEVIREYPTRRIAEIDLRNGTRRIVSEIALGLHINAVSSDASGDNLLVWVAQVEGSDIGSFRLRRRELLPEAS